jgi:hypothetical protein
LVCTIGAISVPGLASGSGAQTTAKPQIILYGLVKSEQFVNNKDDRQRGIGSNPFGNYKDVTATTKQNGKGPFAGDFDAFSFNIYRSPTLKRRAGSATLECTYFFEKMAFCKAIYSLDDGILVGAGPIDFKSGRFALAITGGTGKYEGARGDVESSPAANHSQRLVFRLG